MIDPFKEPGFSCSLAGPGRGDCEHFIGFPGKSIPGQHDGPDDTVDAWGKPNGWCWTCWRSHRLAKSQACCAEMRKVIEDCTCDCPSCDPKGQVKHALSADCGKDFVPRSELNEVKAALDEIIAAVKLMKHVDGCFCEAAFSGPGCHSPHSPECISLCKALNMKGYGWLSPDKAKELENRCAMAEADAAVVRDSLESEKRNNKLLVEATERICSHAKGLRLNLPPPQYWRDDLFLRLAEAERVITAVKGSHD